MKTHKRHYKHLFILLLVVCIGIVSYKIYEREQWRHPFNTIPETEANSHQIDFTSYLKDSSKIVEIAEDLSDDQWRHVGEHTIKLYVNKHEITAAINIVDTTPPDIKGVKNQKVKLGSSISYKKGVTVKDNSDGPVKLSINKDKVNLNKTGKYKVTYTATDESGNKASKKATITVYQESVALKRHKATLKHARALLSKITNASDSKEEKLRKAFMWCRKCPYYTYRDFTKNSYKGWPAVYADDFFLHQRGNCHSGSTAIAYLAIAIGYDATIKRDKVSTKDSHSWCVIDGRVYDPLFSRDRRYGMSIGYQCPESKYVFPAKDALKISIEKCW